MTDISNTYYGSLAQLGDSRAAISASPQEALLESVPNPHPDMAYVVRFTCPEFTSMCPVTGQPDFAYLMVDYIPKLHLVESKSLKLFLGSFRQHGAFHEDCTIMIAKRLIKELDPIWLRIGGYWYPRGGIPIDIFFQHGTIPVGTWIPEQDVPSYKGRG
jgi:7-cyano-7-deazaguanine reductase